MTVFKNMTYINQPHLQRMATPSLSCFLKNVAVFRSCNPSHFLKKLVYISALVVDTVKIFRPGIGIRAVMKVDRNCKGSSLKG